MRDAADRGDLPGARRMYDHLAFEESEREADFRLQLLSAYLDVFSSGPAGDPEQGTR